MLLIHEGIAIFVHTKNVTQNYTIFILCNGVNSASQFFRHYDVFYEYFLLDYLILGVDSYL